MFVRAPQRLDTRLAAPRPLIWINATADRSGLLLGNDASRHQLGGSAVCRRRAVGAIIMQSSGRNGRKSPESPHVQFHRHLSLIHISEPTRLLSISYAVFCLKKKKN